MNYYAVIDTNVLVSSMLKHDSIPGIIVDLCTNGPITPIINDKIVDEYREVLTRNKFDFSEEDVDNAINDFISSAISCDRVDIDEYFKDKGDIVFYEIVMSSNQYRDTYLVTGNIKHFPIKPFVVTPREMLEIINK